MRPGYYCNSESASGAGHFFEPPVLPCVLAHLHSSPLQSLCFLPLMSTALFLAAVAWALPSFQRLVPSQSARDISLPGRWSHLSRGKWALDGRCSGVRRQGRNRVRRAETVEPCRGSWSRRLRAAVQGHVWSPNDMEMIFQGSALNTGQLTRQCQGSQGFALRCRAAANV